LLAAAPLVLRFAPDRRRFAATPKIAESDFVTRAILALALRAPSPKPAPAPQIAPGDLVELE
jgi:hypothetical protein